MRSALAEDFDAISVMERCVEWGKVAVYLGTARLRSKAGMNGVCEIEHGGSLRQTESVSADGKANHVIRLTVG